MGTDNYLQEFTARGSKDWESAYGFSFLSSVPCGESFEASLLCLGWGAQPAQRI